jgi:hypothetical protein
VRVAPDGLGWGGSSRGSMGDGRSPAPVLVDRSGGTGEEVPVPFPSGPVGCTLPLPDRSAADDATHFIGPPGSELMNLR